MPHIETLEVLFANPISQKEVPLLRGAVIASLPKDNILYHNHLGGGRIALFLPSCPIQVS